MSTREEALEAALIDSEYLRGMASSFANSNIPEFQAHHARLLKMAAALAQPVQPTDRTAEFLVGRNLTDGKYAQPVQPAPEPRIAAQVYVGTNGAQVCPMTHGLGDWLASLRPGIHDLVLRRQP